MQTTQHHDGAVQVLIRTVRRDHPDALSQIGNGLFLDLAGRILEPPNTPPAMLAGTGLHDDVRMHVLADPQADAIARQTTRQVRALVATAGRQLVRLTVACADGRRQSVVVAEQAAEYLYGAGIGVETTHVHINEPTPSDADGCVFCAIAAGDAPATVVREWPDAIAIRPRSGGVHEGHLLVLPRTHVADAGVDPEVTAAVMRRAAELMADLPDANLITSKGRAATQTVFHLHVHIVPRADGDELPLPWTPQQTAHPADEQTGETR